MSKLLSRTKVNLFFPFILFVSMFIQYWKNVLAVNGELGGYVHDTAMAQYIPCNAMHCVTGTWTDIAGQVAGTIVRHKAATAETATINIPIMIPSNSVAGKGALLKSVEVDYEILVAACTSWTMSIVKVVRGVDTAVAVVSAPAGTQTLAPATTAATVDQHRDAFTLTTPVWIDNDEYYFLKIVAVAAATTQIDLLSAVANFTERM
jgi:hypothetical protein